MKQTVTEILLRALARAKEKGELKLETQPSITLDTPRDKGHGDLATTLALTLAKPESKPPRKIAEIIVGNIEDRDGILEKTEIAGPGFINFSFKQDRWKQTLFDIEAEGTQYGLANIGKGVKVLVEFVSANPTGPLHVGHGRGAALGDTLANLLAAVGYDVSREFYINDAGRQIRLLAFSVWTRYQQSLGNDVPFPEDGYHGSYIEEIAQSFAGDHGNKYLKVPFDECVDVFGNFGKEAMLADIRTDLDAFGVRFDTWFS
jgi:arginyl-tRNA synthetase